MIAKHYCRWLQMTVFLRLRREITIMEIDLMAKSNCDQHFLLFGRPILTQDGRKLPTLFAENAVLANGLFVERTV